MLKKAGLSAASADDAHHMINLLDKDHDGVISYDEFCRFACLLPAAQVTLQCASYDYTGSCCCCRCCG